MKISIQAEDRGAYDVIVCGGGTAGIVAAIASARRGSRTLLIERRGLPGGMATVGDAGLTKSVIHTHDAKKYKQQVTDRLADDPSSVQVVGGITKEILDRLLASGAGIGTAGQAGSYVFTSLYDSVWQMMDLLDEAGVEPLYLTDLCGVVMEGETVRGVTVHNKSGFSVYRSAVVIDATGDGDVAVLSGAPYALGAGADDLHDFPGCAIGDLQSPGNMYRVDNVDVKRFLDYLETHPELFYVQEFGVMEFASVKEAVTAGEMAVFRFWFGENNEHLMQFYNTPIEGQCIMLMFLPLEGKGNGLDAEETSRNIHRMHQNIRQELSMLRKVSGFEQVRIHYIPDIGIRETRHVCGDYKLMPEDILNDVPWADCIGRGGHPVDVSGAREDVYLKGIREKWSFGIPYRCLLPKGVEGLLMAGRFISLSRIASGAVRTTVQCMETGEAAGVAAALCVKAGLTPRALAPEALTAALRSQGVVL